MLIIYAHPNKEGHCGFFLENVTQILQDKKIEFEIIDLYEIGFSPVLKPEEHYTSGHKEVASQVQEIQEKIKKHDKFIFIYPTWWQNVPGILKGFIDRVFIPGFGFIYEGKMPQGLLKGKEALIFTSTGAPRFITKFIYRDRSIKVLKKDILSFCGIKSKAYVIDNARYFSDNQKERIKQLVPRAMKNFFTLLLAFFLFLPGLASTQIENWQEIHEEKYWMSRDEKQETADKDAVTQESMYLRALANLTLRREEQAESVFRDILELSSDNIQVRWGIAEIDRRNYKLEESRKVLEDIIQDQPGIYLLY